MKLAVLGVGHWHAPGYLDDLVRIPEAEVIALSDPCPEAVERAAAQAPRARTYADYRDLLDAEAPDLVFAHAPHDEMTALAVELVARGLPFHMEKPMGLDWRALDEVARCAMAQGLFVSLPLVTRYFGVASRLLDLRAEGALGDPLYFSFRLFAGPPQRYLDMHVPWMLDPARAGEGPLFNFGPHATDLFLALTGPQPRRVTAWATNALYGLAIPDLVGYLVEADGGCRGVIEVSYTTPAGYQRYFSLTTTTLDYGGAADIGVIHLRDGGTMDVDGPPGDEGYHTYVRDCLRRFAAGEPPLVGMEQMVAVLRVLNAAQRSLREGGPVEV